MEQENNKLDGVINKVFSKDVQQKRVKKELQSLKELDSNHYKISLQTTAQGLKLIVEVCEDVIIGELSELKHTTLPIIFEILMDQNFPFNAPKLYPKTNFYKTTIADGRDFILDVIQRNWNPAILVKDIINLLPKFIKKLEELPNPEKSQLLGEFHLGSVFALEDYFLLPNSSVFPGEEIIQERNDAVIQKIFVVVESFFLTFEPADKTKNTIKLTGWAHVQSIANVKKSKENAKKIVITWINKSSKSGVIQNTYLVDEAQGLLEILVRSSQKYGVRVSKAQQKRDLSLAEVTIKSYEEINIEELLDNITYLESQLDTQITIGSVNLLMNLYQKAVEYFSAFNDPAFEDFMMRLHGLLQRHDVQAVLSSQEDHQPKKQDKSDKKDHEEEEEEKGEQKKPASESPKKSESPNNSNSNTNGTTTTGKEGAINLETTQGVTEKLEENKPEDSNKIDSNLFDLTDEQDKEEQDKFYE